MVLYGTVLYHTVTSLDDTHLLIKPNAWSIRQKFSGGGGGGIAIIASSSRSRQDFEIELNIEICDRT